MFLLHTLHRYTADTAVTCLSTLPIAYLYPERWIVLRLIILQQYWSDFAILKSIRAYYTAVQGMDVVSSPFLAVIKLTNSV